MSETDLERIMNEDPSWRYGDWSGYAHWLLALDQYQLGHPHRALKTLDEAYSYHDRSDDVEAAYQEIIEACKRKR